MFAVEGNKPLTLLDNRINSLLIEIGDVVLLV
jgi:hypothetical protein